MKDKLTPEEQVMHDEYVQGRFDRALMPVDKELAENTVRELLGTLNIKIPRIIWTPSPRVAQVVIASLSGYHTKKPKLEASETTLKLAEKVLAEHGFELEASGIETPAAAWFGGDGWSNGWIAFYSFVSRISDAVVDPLQLKQLRLQETLSDITSFIYSFENATIMTERPKTSWTSRLITERPVLHNASGPSVEYPDMRQYHWKGTRVPKQFIMDPGSVDLQLALTMENVEQRLALCEILGWEKILKAFSPRVLDKNPDDRFGELLEVDLPRSPKQRILRAKCGTGRWISLLASETANTALEAGAESYGVSPELYAQLKLRT